MATPASRKPLMTLYSDTALVECHCCRIVIFEKDVECQIHHMNADSDTDVLAELNPYNEAPTLVDRDLILYGSQIICEYLDERLPHPPLMPVDPVNRGKARLMIMRIIRDWYSLISIRDGKAQLQDDLSRQTLRDGLISISPIFVEQPYMLGSEYSLVDCFMAPLLWRLHLFGVDLPHQAQAVMQYANRIFERPAFVSSLTEPEQEMRP